MSYLTPAMVQQWLEKTKFTVTLIDAARETTARDLVFGRVVSKYTTTGWVDSDTTPSLILSIMSAFYAAWTYNSIVSEDMGESDYATSLLRMMETMLLQISDGTLDIPGETVATLGSPSFFPTDIQDSDEQGNEIKFTMGVTY